MSGWGKLPCVFNGFNKLTFLIIQSMLKTVVLLNIFVQTLIHFLRIL